MPYRKTTRLFNAGPRSVRKLKRQGRKLPFHLGLTNGKFGHSVGKPRRGTTKAKRR